MGRHGWRDVVRRCRLRRMLAPLLSSMAFAAHAQGPPPPAPPEAAQRPGGVATNELGRRDQLGRSLSPVNETGPVRCRPKPLYHLSPGECQRKAEDFRDWRRAPGHSQYVDTAASINSSDGYRFIFVGGLHNSGTSVMERLFSTQDWAVGLAPDDIRNKLPRGMYIEGCLKSQCGAPESEAIFLTKAHLFRTDLQCDSNESRCEQMILNASRGGDPELVAAYRDVAWREWSRFWSGCSDKTRFLVAKDIRTLIDAPMLQAAFGSHRSTFVFAIRHPFTIQLGSGLFKTGSVDDPTNLEALEVFCDSWLRQHERLIDECQLERSALVNIETLAERPGSVLAGLGELLAEKDETSSLPFRWTRSSIVEQRRLAFRTGSANKTMVSVQSDVIRPEVAAKLDALRNSGTFRERFGKRFDAGLRRFCYSTVSLRTTEACKGPFAFVRGLDRPSAPNLGRARGIQGADKCPWATFGGGRLPSTTEKKEDGKRSRTRGVRR